MGVGNAGQGANSGNRGSNHNYEHRHLLAIGEMLQSLGLLATEATLVSVLNAIVAHQDMEILLVRDTGNGDLVVQQVREYDETTQTWSTVYQDVNGAPYVPVGPLQYLDPSAILNLMLAELLDQGLTLDDIELNTDTNATEATLLLTLALLQTIDADTSNLDVLLSTRASEATLLATNVLLTTMDAVLDNILLDTTSIDTRLTPAVRTHNTVSTSAAGSVAAGSLSGSVINVGNAAGTWNGISIPAGVSIPWGPIGNRDTYGAIAYDGSGTTLIIEYTT